MAVINLSVTIPNAQLARVQAAVRWFYGQVSDDAGEFRDMTDQEVLDKLRYETILKLKDMVRQCERYKAARAAEILDAMLDVT